MQDGEVVQIGTPVELFERPQHTFVGHFIGSPGMNVLPCEWRGDHALFDGHHVALEGPARVGAEKGDLKIGVRPEHIRIAAEGIPAVVTKVADVGRHYVVEARVGDTPVKAVLDHGAPEQGEAVHLAFRPEMTRLYQNGWIATEART